ncbi:hypothetical protein Tco_1578179 [Tanacetum coccineum]
MSNQQDIYANRAKRLAKTHDPLALMANTQTPFHPDQLSNITYMQHSQPNNNNVQQHLFNPNYIQQSMPNLEDISDPTTAIDMELVLIAKAFNLNNTTPTNNNQTSSSNPSNRQTVQLGMNIGQDRQMLMVKDIGGIQFRQIVNQNGNGNVAAARTEGNGNRNNENQIRCYNFQGVHSKAKEKGCFLSSDLTADCSKGRRSKSELHLKDNLQQASTSGTQTDNAPVYDSDGSTELNVRDFKSLEKEADASLDKHKALEFETERLLRAVVSQDIMSIVQNNSFVDTSELQTELERTKERFENCIIKKENEYAKLWNDWYKKYEECKSDKILYDKAYNNMQLQIERLQAQLGDIKGKISNTQCTSNTLDPLYQILDDENVSLEFQVLNCAKENEHLKNIYKNLFESIKVTRAQTKIIIDSLQAKLNDMIFESITLRGQLHIKFSEQQNTVDGTKCEY